jgi:hypothetical protein
MVIDAEIIPCSDSSEEKSGTTKVQLGADSTSGADGAEHKNCSFPRKIKNSQ